MNTEGGQAQVTERREHIAVLAGDKKISDMLVFLLYRKLKNTRYNCPGLDAKATRK